MFQQPFRVSESESLPALIPPIELDCKPGCRFVLWENHREERFKGLGFRVFMRRGGGGCVGDSKEGLCSVGFRRRIAFLCC